MEKRLLQLCSGKLLQNIIMVTVKYWIPIDKERFNIQEFHSLILDESIHDIDISDEVKSSLFYVFKTTCGLQHGMTPLMHCAYHGYLEPCTKLLARGADVNNNKQKDGVSSMVVGSSTVIMLVLFSTQL